MSEQDYAAMVDLAVQHLSLTDCPAQETVQLQVILCLVTCKFLYEH